MKTLALFISLVVIGSYVDRISIPTPSEYSRNLIIDGLITNEPGPYTVKISQAMKIDAALPLGLPASVKKITLFDNAGNSEVLEEKDKGIYQTSPTGMQGVVGREYYIQVEANDGYVFESLPDKMNPVGQVDSIYYEFETRQPEDRPTEYGYRIFIDAHTTSGNDNFLRWKFTGTYVVETLLDRYCDEFSYRYNTRKVTDVQRFHHSVTRAEGRRLRYAELTSL